MKIKPNKRGDGFNVTLTQTVCKEEKVIVDISVESLLEETDPNILIDYVLEGHLLASRVRDDQEDAFKLLDCMCFEDVLKWVEKEKVYRLCCNDT